MASQKRKPVIDFGDAAQMAPSTRRVDARGWLAASAVFGAAAAWLALWIAWRPLPWLAEPPGELSSHVAALARCLAHRLFSPVFRASSEGYLRYLADLGPDTARGLIWRWCFGAWAFFMPAVLLARWCLTPRDALTEVRGAARYDGAEAVEALNALLDGDQASMPDHEIAPGVSYPSNLWTRHVLVVAGSGSGKSTALKGLISAIVGSGESLLLFDPKGEFTQGLAGPDLIAPWDSRSLAWDIARDMRNVGDMRRFAGSMIGEAHDPMWSNAAKQILVGFMIYLKSTRGDDWGWREFADLMAIPQGSLLPMMEEHHPEAIRSVERAGVTTQGILINLAAFSAPVFDLATAWGDTPRSRRVSFVDWAMQRGGPRQLILQGHGAYPDLTRSCLEGIVGTVAAIVSSVELDDDPNRKLWFVADEAPKMGAIPIQPLLDMGRAKGFRCVLACQDLAQLEEIHGANMVKAAVSMVGTLIVGQLLQGDTAQQMSKAMGSREVERANVSVSTGGGTSPGSASLSYAREELALYMPSELASRLGPTKNRQGVKLALVTGGNTYELFWPWFPLPVARPAHVPAPWTVAFAAAAPPVNPAPQRVEETATWAGPSQPSSAQPAALDAHASEGAFDAFYMEFDAAEFDDSGDEPAVPIGGESGSAANVPSDAGPTAQELWASIDFDESRVGLKNK